MKTMRVPNINIYVKCRDKITFSQDECTGAGADTNERVSWEKKLSKKEIQELTSLDYINSDKWIDAQPINFK